MLPSNSSPHPSSYSDQPFDFESNPTSNQETINCDEYFSNSPPNLSFFHFPNSPFEDYQFSHDFLLEFQHQSDNLLLAEPEPEPQPIVNNMDEEEIMGVSSNKKITKVPRKKRDRHSKINTARGLRDPRMRLSLKVAKRFFRLQDMLGFEKASKTVEWLLNQAKEEINHVAAAAAKSSVSPSSTFECEGLSSPEEVVRKPPGVKRRTKKHSSRKFIARECREKARERARERTKQKMMRSNQQCELEATTNHKLSQLGSCKSPNPSLDLVTNARELISSTSLSEKLLGTGEATVHDDRFFGYYYEQKEHHHFFLEFSE